MKKIYSIFIFALIALSSVSVFGQNFANLGTGTAVNGTSASSPVNNYYRRNVCQFVYTAAELTAAGVPAGASISQIGWFVTQNANQAKPGYTIKMKHVGVTNVAGALGTTGWTTVVNSFTYPTNLATNAWQMRAFTTPFVWNGTSSIGVEVCWAQTAGWSSTGQCRIYSTTSGYRYSWTDATGTSCGLSPGIVNSNKPQARLAWTPASSCSGTPNAGTATISSSSGCPSVNFTIESSGTTSGNGISYQWESAPTAGGPWTNIAGETNTSLTTSATTTTFYRLRTTCSNGGATNTTNVVSYTITSCLNVPSAGSNTNPCGTNVSLFDSGGSGGNYVNNSNGFTVLENAGSAIISLSGTSVGEACCDYVRIFRGVGTGGVVVGTYYMNSAIPTITSVAGEALTVQFFSDGSVVGAGFQINVSYSGSCVPTSPPPCASSPTAPTNAATGVSLATTLSWPAVAGATGYDVYFGTSNPATTLVSSNQPGTTFNPGTLNASTTYFWRIVPRNSVGSASGCATWSFTTGVPGCNSGALYTSYTPVCNGTQESYAGCTWAGEYNNLTLVGGTAYNFGSSIASDFITITNSTGTILASGTQPVNYTPTASGTYRVYIHTNSACGTASACRNPWVQCGTPPPPGPCIQPTPYLTVNAPTTTASLTISTCTYAGEYNTINNVVIGQTYEFSSSVGSDWLTLTDASNNSLEFGTSPITWTATFSGTVRLHVSAGSNCATQNTCRTTTVTCTSCAPPCPVPSNNTCASAPILNLGANNNQTHLGTGCGSTTTLPGATFKEVWVAFTVPCGGMNVAIDFCGSTPVHNDAYLNIFTDCSFNTFTGANNWDFTSCGDGNIRLFWNNVPEGTYYYPILIAPAWETDYVLNISGTPLYTPAVAPTSISGTTAVCAGQSATLTLQGGSAGTNGLAQWFAGSCGSAVIGTGNSITVSPTGNTTYFVRYSGSCNTTTCASSTITVNNPTLATPPANGDMVWRGASSNDWATLPNWWQFNGTAYVAASAAPTPAQNVIIPANQACVLNQPNTNANAGSAKTLRIESGATLTMGNGTITIAENWVNNGTFTPGTGTVSFTGSGTHTISGISGAHNFHNLTMNKSGEVQLSVPIVMSGALTLTNGRLDIGNFNLDLPSNTVNGGNTASFVRTSGTGTLNRNVANSAVLFPVGRGSYNPATLTNAGTADKYSIRVIDNVTDDGTAVGAPTTMAVVNRTWMINEQVAGGSNVTLGLQWNGLPEEMNNFSEIGSFVAHYIAGEGLWDNIGGTVQASGVIQASGIMSFSPFTVSSDNAFAPLPVELIAFTAQCNNEDVIVNWSTATEHNSQYFALQVSEDGYSWSDLYVIEAAEFSTTVLEYSYIHKNAARTKNYYRLRQFDNDGTVETYNTIMSNCTSDENVFMTFPNPSADAFTVLVNDKQLSGANVLNISDASGKLIYSIAVDLENGSGSFAVEGLDMPAGLYYLQLNNGSYASRIIKHSFR